MGKPQREPTFLKVTIGAEVYEQLGVFKEKWQGQKVEEVVVRVNTGHGHSYEMRGTLQSFLEKLGLEKAAGELLLKGK
jgi:hypothetical protein